MMVKIEGVLDAAGVRRVREIIDAGPWVDGNETSGFQSTPRRPVHSPHS